MSRRHSIADARNNLSELVRQAESGKPIELTRRADPVTVLIGRREYDRLTAPPPTFGDAWKEFSRSIDVRQANIDPDEVFATYAMTHRAATPSFADAQIAAIAHVHDLTVVTFNTSDFTRFEGLQVTTW